jgi:hypothetical protein
MMGCGFIKHSIKIVGGIVLKGVCKRICLSSHRTSVSCKVRLKE